MASLEVLKTKCVHPDTKKSYIKSVRLGRDNSPEGFQVSYSLLIKTRIHTPLRSTALTEKNGYTHMVVSEFGSAADRDYYALKDPVHLALAGGLPPFIAALQVLDIES